MKKIADTLRISWEKVDDPGDYPNSLAQTSLPSQLCPVIDGEITVEAETEKDLENLPFVSEWINDFSDVPDYLITWKTRIQGNTCTASVDRLEF